MTRDVFEPAEQIGDAVMYEGYVLYPYRASAVKNRTRWQFGVVAPRAYCERTGADTWYARTECVLEPGPSTHVSAKVRCLQLQQRRVEESHGGEWRARDRMVVDGREYLAWDEAVPRFVRLPAVPLDQLCGQEMVVPFDLEPSVEEDRLGGQNGDLHVRISRLRWPVRAVVRVSAEPRGRVVKLSLRVENVTPEDAAVPERAVALRHALLGCHLLLHAEGGEFVSMTDPPPHAEAAVRSCVNEHSWPVLAGAHGARDLVLASPIILADYPAVAPESPHSFFDGTEIDEMLALRVMTMTEAERREASATDPHAAAILDAVDRHDEATLETLHGAVRSFEELLQGDGPPENAFVDVGDVRLAAGTRVRLTPRRRSDSLDVFLDGRTATIAMVHRDLESRVHLAVTLDDDPGADLKHAYGRFFYFSPDEVQPVSPEDHEP